MGAALLRHCMEDAAAGDDPVEPEVAVTRVSVTAFAFRPVKNHPVVPTIPAVRAVSVTTTPLASEVPVVVDVVPMLPRRPSPFTVDTEFEEVEF